MKNNQFRFFSGKIVTSLSKIFTIEKAYPNLFSGINFLFVNRFSKILEALFKTYGMQNGDMVIFILSSFRKVRF